jgi:hypothetical protein
VHTIDDEGWIRLYRKSIRSQVFQSDGLWKIWTWCLMKANHEDRWIPVKTGRGNTEVLIRRGDFLFGRKTAAKELKMKPTTVQDRIKKLANMQNLVINPVTHYSIVTVCNYDFYQGKNNDEASPNPSPNRQPTVTNKNDKNEKNTTLSGKKTPDPRVKEFLDSWGETFLQQTGQPYVFSFAKEGKLVKDLLKVHSLDLLQDIVRAFFKDERCIQRGLDIGIFKKEVNRLLGMRTMDPLEQAKKELGMR